MWDGSSYDRFQEKFQFLSGTQLIEQLEGFTAIEDMRALDLGCGNGQVTGVELDRSMLEVLENKYINKSIKFFCADMPE